MVRTFVVIDVFIRILARRPQRCIVITFDMGDVSIGILAHFAINLFVCCS